MDLSTKQWHVRLYRFSQQVWQRFTNGMDGGGEWYPQRTDLCHYIRSIFVLMPLAFLLNILFWCWVIWALIIFPSDTLGLGGYLTELVVIAAIVGVTVGGFYLWDKRQTRLELESYKGKSKSKKTEESPPGLFKLLRTRVASAHNRFCVNIRIKDDGNE